MTGWERPRRAVGALAWAVLGFIVGAVLVAYLAGVTLP